MNILVCDDEKPALEMLLKMVQEAVPDAEVYDFFDAEKALECAKVKRFDIAFLDIEMGSENGLVVAKKLKDIYGKINIIFVTAYSEYALQAHGYKASGYLLKPVSAEDIKEEIHNLRYPINNETNKRVRIQTFGNFEFFVDNRIVAFPRSKSKELLAYIVDRKGAGVTTAEVGSVLWEDKDMSRSQRNQTQVIISDMMKTLKKQGVEDIVVKAWNSIAIDVEKVDCDYYKALGGDMIAFNSFNGEYMNNYSWAEFTLGMLFNKF